MGSSSSKRKTTNVLTTVNVVATVKTTNLEKSKTPSLDEKQTGDKPKAQTEHTEQELVVQKNIMAGEVTVSRTQKKVKAKTGRWQDTDLETLMKQLTLEDKTWWDVVDQLCVKTLPVVEPEKQRKGWKTIRLFVSSTFKDMQSERNYLVKFVFPSLRKWCEERKLRLVDCDLRWGVPKDADTRETLLACLSEIDRCHEENVFPYFLNLISERYGWVPEAEEIPEDIKSRYKWLPGMSVTALEIFVGAYWERNPNSLFLMRDPKYLESVSDQDILSVYTETNEQSKESLKMLKDKLRDKFQDRVMNYKCEVEKIADGKIKFDGFSEFGKMVKGHFKKCIEKQYPADSLGQELTQAEIMKAEHETFMMQRSQVLLGRDAMISDINYYISSEVKSAVPMVLVGYPGAGKSALVAYSARECVKNSSYKLFYHFIGATSRSTDLYSILARFFMEFMPAQKKMPEDQDEMMRFTETMIELAAEKVKSEGFTRLVIFIDALNQMDDEGGAQSLTWLPRQLPAGVRLIVSTLEGKCLDALRNNPVDPFEISVEPLGVEIRKDIVQKILSEYNKQLDGEQMDLLVSKEDAGRPLWLTVACEELRVFGEFRQLTNKITNLPGELSGLLKVVQQRIVQEYGRELVIATLCLIETSKFGLGENELLELLSMEPTLPSDAVKTDKKKDQMPEKLPMAKWALVYLGLNQFLRPCGGSGEGRLDFYHRTISKVVRDMFLQNEEDRKWWHRRLAKYFANYAYIERKAEELPYHQEMAGDKEELKTCLLEQNMFDQLYQESRKPQLMKYWRYVGGYETAAQCYVSFLKTHFVDNKAVDIDNLEPVQSKIAWFLIDIGQYDTAQMLLDQLLQMVEKKHGKAVKQMADSLHAMVLLFYRKALMYVYGSSPGYRQCRRLGEGYAKLCSEVHRKHWPEMDNHRGHVLTLCGYFISECLSEARTIFQASGDKQGLAQVLYMLGEKEQYNKEMDVPIQYFTQSMSLCISSFGKVHLHTARCAQLFGQLYWNSYVSKQKRKDWMETCLSLYQLEIEILEEILGPLHPNTVRSREDVIIILQTLNRHPEAEEYRKKQPAEHDAV